jgi:hypothetical protein
MSHPQSAEVVQDIRRKPRRRFSAEKKIRIVLEGLRGKTSSLVRIGLTTYTGSVTGIRVVSNDASGTKLEVCLRNTGTIRGVAQSTLWRHRQLIRPDGSICGQGGDVLQLTGHGSGQAPSPGDPTKFRTMLHVQTAASDCRVEVCRSEHHRSCRQLLRSQPMGMP